MLGHPKMGIFEWENSNHINNTNSTIKRNSDWSQIHYLTHIHLNNVIETPKGPSINDFNPEGERGWYKKCQFGVIFKA